MWLRRKSDEKETSCRSAAKAGLASAPREVLIREAIHALATDGRAERVGVWLVPDFSTSQDPIAAACLRGLVWEAQAEETPADWERLSLKPPCRESCSPPATVSTEDLDDSIGETPNSAHDWPSCWIAATLSAFLFWAPTICVACCSPQHVGSRQPCPGILAESVAAELALALEFEQEKKLALLRNAAVEGYRSMVDGIVGVILFLLSSGPSLLLWAAVLFFPARGAWRMMRRRWAE